jgi:hypothetical protein
MALPIYNIEINQFATFKMSLNLSGTADFSEPTSWSLWSFTGSLAPQYPGEANQIVEFDIVSSSVGTLAVSLPPSKTSQLVETAYVYDILAIKDLPLTGSTVGNEVYRILQGKVKVNLGVTEAREP